MQVNNLQQLNIFINKISESRNIPADVIKHAIENVFVEILNVHFMAETFVDFVDDQIHAWMFRNHACIPVDFKHLPYEVIKQIRTAIKDDILQVDDENNYLMWCEKIHTVRRGTIIRFEHNNINVEVDGFITTMKRNQWNVHDKYSSGDSLIFYISKVLRPCNIFVSRNTKQLGPAILKKYYPWGNFVCQKRIVGVKSIIITDMKVDRDNIREIAQELKEVLILKYQPELFRKN